MKCVVDVPRVPASELRDTGMPTVDETLGYELGVCRWDVRPASDEGAELVLLPNDSLLIPTRTAAAILAAMRAATETMRDLVRDELGRAWAESEDGLYGVSSGTHWAPYSVSSETVRWIHVDDVRGGDRWLRPLSAVA